MVVIHCKGHQGHTSLEAIGNNMADKEAKRAASIPFLAIETAAIPISLPQLPPDTQTMKRKHS